jgi:transposase
MGCRFVERILSVDQTVRLRGGRVLDFLADTLTAHRHGLPASKVLAIG